MNWSYCPSCGQKGTVIAFDSTEYKCSSCDTLYWNNPRLAVGVILLNENGEMLFSERGVEPNKGKYDVPGGFMEFGEDIFDCCIREIKEELNIALEKEDLSIVAVNTVEYLPGVSVADTLVFAKKWKGTPQPADDVSGYRWEPVEFMDDEQFAPRPRYKYGAKTIKAYLKK